MLGLLEPELQGCEQPKVGARNPAGVSVRAVCASPLEVDFTGLGFTILWLSLPHS